MNVWLNRITGLTRLVSALVVLALVATAAIVLLSRDDEQYLTVDFPQTNSVYKGSQVKVIGVPIGKVESLSPRGDVVRVKIAYDADVRLPADVKAVVVSPSIVGDRFVQLTPAYGGGARLKDGAYLAKSRTAVPVELDQVYKSLDDLSVALGPKGANQDGALSSLVDDTAGQLDGQGRQLNQTIKDFGKLSTTLDDNKDELFGSMRQVNDFVSLLKENDAEVRRFNDSTAKVADVLAGERDDLSTTLSELSTALVDVRTLVKDNRGELRGNVDNLESLTAVLAKRQKELEEITVGAPTALSNIALAYNGKTGTLDTRTNLTGLITDSLADPSSLLCSLLGETPDDGGLCKGLSDLTAPLDGKLKLPRAAAGAPVESEKVDDSVAAMLGVDQ